jgi:hypothetical protein
MSTRREALARDDVKNGPEYEPAREFDPECVDTRASYSTPHESTGRSE